MKNQRLTCEKIGNVCVIRWATVKSAEEIAQSSSDLRDLSRELPFDSAVRVIVLTGGDETSFVIKPAAPAGPGKTQMSCSLSDPLASLDVPVIAALGGDAAGQGLEMALACDLRIASEGSRFGLPHIKTGLMPSDGGTQRLSRLVGRSKSIEMILTGKMIDAREALRIGLLNRVVPSESLMTVTLQLAKDMAGRAPIAVKYTKEAVSEGMEMTLEQALRLEADLYLLLHTTQDRTEGIQAFLGKKPPRFEGK